MKNNTLFLASLLVLALSTLTGCEGPATKSFAELAKNSASHGAAQLPEDATLTTEMREYLHFGLPNTLDLHNGVTIVRMPELPKVDALMTDGKKIPVNSWPELVRHAAWAVHAQGHDFMDEETRNEHAYLFLNKSVLPGLGRKQRLQVASALIELMNHFPAAEQIGNWAVKAVAKTLRPEDKQQVRLLILATMKASAIDFGQFDAAMKVAEHRCDKANDQGTVCDEGYNFETKSDWLEGMFYRRWKEQGGGKSGEKTIQRMRGWMTRLAEELEMEEAKSWPHL